MKDYKEISVEDYCIQELECICNDCKSQFYDYMELNYELVCFKDEVGKKYFLPTYGKYGYLYLLERLVDEWNENDRITKIVTEKFERKLNEITQYSVTLCNRVSCPICKQCNVNIENRNPVLTGRLPYKHLYSYIWQANHTTHSSLLKRKKSEPAYILYDCWNR